VGYSARYHAASLAAVFVGLAIGILIGVGLGSDVISGTAEDLERSLESDLDEARARVDELEAELEAEREFSRQVSPTVVADVLNQREIALIGLGGLGQDVTGDVEEAIEAAGASLAEVAVVRLPPDLDALASPLKGTEARAIARGGEEELLRYAERAGRVLTSGGRRFDELRRTMLSRYSGSPEGIDGVVVVRQLPDDLDPGAEVTTGAIEEGLIAGLRSSAETVGAERTDADPSSIEFFQQNGIASVDNVESNSGRVALVFALDGAAGSFGIKETADSLLPDLLPSPAGAIGSGSGRDGGS
jgi:Copper transport outer membrane protein, MctB